MSEVEPLPQVEDRHNALATHLFGEKYTPEQRRLAKAINFWHIYTSNVKTISQSLGLDAAATADLLLKAKEFNKGYQAVVEFVETAKRAKLDNLAIQAQDAPDVLLLSLPKDQDDTQRVPVATSGYWDTDNSHEDGDVPTITVATSDSTPNVVRTSDHKTIL